ncbi:MAG TPA: metallopeptidase TldD-related protein [Candidatus Limnocylindrales bacterium]|nr:metallopeptidase TldD-related protein [Candidatus Limnocylindrales bacterium]
MKTLLTITRRTHLSELALLAVLFISMTSAGAQPASAQAGIASSSPALTAQATAAKSDPVLQAMLAELDRSKDQLKMESVARPYYVEYRVTDIDEFDANAEFGSLLVNQRVKVRVLRAVVRIGDYKQDSYFGQGQGVAETAPIENDVLALRHALWLATDSAYKAAGEALAAKQAMMKEITPDQTVNDFAQAEPLVAVEPLAKLQFDEGRTTQMLEAATALYRQDPEIQVLSASARFTVFNEYYVNTEGTITRRGQTLYATSVAGSTQAADGMRLDRSPAELVATPEELPTEAKFVAEAQKVMDTLKALREAPVVDEEYRGPVLLSPDAASDVLATLIGDNAAGRKPAPGRNGRTVGAFASGFKSRVLPQFISIVDDPTKPSFQGHSLTGSYTFDDDGVRVTPVTVIDKGQLVNFLVGRQPIQDFPASNGHDRAPVGSPPQPHYGVLTLQPSESSSPEELRKRLIQMCHDQGKPYGYRVETLSGNGLTSPRLLYRVWANDGHEELVRGSLLNELDVRGLRNDLIAVGNDPFVSNRSGNIQGTVISPSMLFDELEIRRDDRAKGKLPEYTAPPISASAHQ